MATQMVTANSLKSRPRMPPMNSTGMKTAASESVMETMVKPISPRAPQRRLERPLAHLDVADDVLQHHDRVVHHESDGEDQRHHRKIVEAETQQVHHRERADDGERQRHAGNDGGRDVAQEQEDHHHHQAQREHHGELDVLVGFANGVGAVVEDIQVDRRRQLGAEGGQQALDAVGDLNGVGAGLALDGQDDGAAAVLVLVVPGGGLIVFDAVDYLAEFLQAHGRALAVGHHHRPVLRRGHQLPAGLQGEGPLRPDNGAGGEVDVPGLEGGLDFVDADLPRRQRVRIHLRVNGVFLRAQHLHLGHAGNHGNALGDARFGVFVQRPERQRGRGEGEIEDGLIGGVDLGEGGRRGHALGQHARSLGDGRLHVHGGAVELAAQVEFQRDLGIAERVRRRHGAQPGDHRELIFERRGHRRGHGFGAGAGKARRHQQGGQVHVGQVAHGQGAIRHGAEQRDGGHQQAGGDGSLDEGFGDVHGQSPACITGRPTLPGFRAPRQRSRMAAIYVYATGVRYRVINCEKAKPPTTAMPSGLRDSPPAP